MSHGVTRIGCLHHERGVVTRLGALTFGARRAPSSPVVARSLQRAASRTFAADRPFAKLLFGATLESATTTPTVTSEWLRRPILMHHVISRRDARVGDHGADGYFRVVKAPNPYAPRHLEARRSSRRPRRRRPPSWRTPRGPRTRPPSARRHRRRGCTCARSRSVSSRDDCR